MNRSDKLPLSGAFAPKFTITARIAMALMRIEGAKVAIQHLPITPTVLATLRESARMYSTHYSTMIEGNRHDHQPRRRETVCGLSADGT